MLIGKNKRKISQNLIISRFFEEENNEIQNEYFIRNIADELSIVSLGAGGFFAVINPCSFEIEYDSDTFSNVFDMNLREVEKFEPKAATVFRLYNQQVMPKFNISHIKKTLNKRECQELDEALEAVTGVNNQYGIEQALFGASFDTIKINMDALTAANYKKVNSTQNEDNKSLDGLDMEIARRKRELEFINQKLAAKENEYIEVEDKLEKSQEELDMESFILDLDEIDKLLSVDAFFDQLDELSVSSETESEELEDFDFNEFLSELEEEEKNV